jgi:hypothetical protein
MQSARWEVRLRRSSLALVVVLGLLAQVPSTAHAAEPQRFEALASAGIGVRHTTSIDLADEADASGHGSGNDAGPAALGLELRAGVLSPVSLELDVTGVVAAGGLDLAGVERRYFGQTEEIGSTASVGLEASLRFAPALSPDLRLLAGPAFGWQRLAASSPAGMARVDLLGVGLDLGARLRVNTISRVVDGHLELVVRGRRELPLEARVQRSSDPVLFSGTGGGEPIYSAGIGLSYVFSFHAKMSHKEL